MSPSPAGPQASVYFVVKVNENGFYLEKSVPVPTPPCFAGDVLKVFRMRAGIVTCRGCWGETIQVRRQWGVAEKALGLGAKTETRPGLCHLPAV